MNAELQEFNKENAKGQGVGGINKDSIHIYNLTIWHKVMKKEEDLFKYMKNYLSYLMGLKKTPPEKRKELKQIKNNIIKYNNYNLNY